MAYVELSVKANLPAAQPAGWLSYAQIVHYGAAHQPLRDRLVMSEPQVVKKRQWRVSKADEIVTSWYAMQRH